MISNPLSDFLIELSTVVVLFTVYRYRHGLYQKILYMRPRWNEFIERFEKDVPPYCQIRFNNIFTSFLIPVLSMLAYWYWLLCINNGINSPIDPLLTRLSAVILTPIHEEIIVRGIMLGLISFCCALLIFKKFKCKESKAWWVSIYVIALILSAIIFSLLHGEGIDLRYLTGILFGVLYFIDRRNLLPAIIAHSVNNLMAGFIYSCFI